MGKPRALRAGTCSFQSWNSARLGVVGAQPVPVTLDSIAIWDRTRVHRGASQCGAPEASRLLRGSYQASACSRKVGLEKSPLGMETKKKGANVGGGCILIHPRDPPPPTSPPRTLPPT